MTDLNSDLAARFMRLTLSHLGRQYPYKMDLVFEGPDDARPPIAHHPIFHGSFDWHSCVHGWWQVMRLARLFPELPEAALVRDRANVMLVPDKVAGECAFLERSSAKGFERPYGWAWLLALHGELSLDEGPWASALEPLALAFAERFHAFLPKLTYPMRVGTHFNIAFALVLARRWATARDARLVALIDARALEWFGKDENCPAWEPGGDEFLSSALTEALLMSEILPFTDYRIWFDRFLPRAPLREPATLFNPAFVSDRSDGKIAHLDGLNLSRAWCWRHIAARLEEHPVREPALEAARAHIEASLPHVAGNYMGEHWLATFALLALQDRPG